MLEQMGHRLTGKWNVCSVFVKRRGLEGMDITQCIEDKIDISNVLKECTPIWDGGMLFADKPEVERHSVCVIPGVFVRLSTSR